MALGRILLAWAVVAAWLVGWQWVERRRAGDDPLSRRELPGLAAEGLVVTLLAALWFASLGVINPLAKAMVSSASAVLALTPVPIAHTGS
jgi:hypothetical protein